MRAGYQVGQVVIRDSIDHQTQWRDHLEQFRAARDVGFDTYCWAHHYLIDPFQHFQPFPVLARLAGETGGHEAGDIGHVAAPPEPGGRGRAGGDH